MLSICVFSSTFWELLYLHLLFCAFIVMILISKNSFCSLDPMLFIAFCYHFMGNITVKCIFFSPCTVSVSSNRLFLVCFGFVFGGWCFVQMSGCLLTLKRECLAAGWRLLNAQVGPAGFSCLSPFTGNLSWFHVWMVAGILGTKWRIRLHEGCLSIQNAYILIIPLFSEWQPCFLLSLWSPYWPSSHPLQEINAHLLQGRDQWPGYIE